jgi:hypothetical protein
MRNFLISGWIGKRPRCTVSISPQIARVVCASPPSLPTGAASLVAARGRRVTRADLAGRCRLGIFCSQQLAAGTVVNWTSTVVLANAMISAVGYFVVLQKLYYIPHF